MGSKGTARQKRLALSLEVHSPSGPQRGAHAGTHCSEASSGEVKGVAGQPCAGEPGVRAPRRLGVQSSYWENPRGTFLAGEPGQEHAGGPQGA